MTSKERVKRNYTFQPIDRFSIGYEACSEITSRLSQWYCVETYEELLTRLHVDFRCPGLGWIGPQLVDDQDRRIDCFGIPRAGVGDFGYALDHPLADLSSVAQVDAYPWPTVDTWDYDKYAQDCASFEEYAVLAAAWDWFFGLAADLVGMERWFCLLYDNPALAHAVIRRIVDYAVEVTEIMFQKASKYIDIHFTGDDYGVQNGPMFSMAVFDEFIRPYLQRIYDTGKRYGKLTMHHSCGSVVALIPALIEMGVNILEPIQASAVGMNPVELARQFGGKLCFHGSIDTQHTLPFGTPDDVRREVQARVETFTPHGGFTISPSQSLLPEIPIENIVAMYSAAWEYAWVD